MNNNGSFSGMFSFCRALWKSLDLVLFLVASLLSESLLVLNYTKTLLSSELTVLKSPFILLCEKDRLVLSANIICSRILETLL